MGRIEPIGHDDKTAAKPQYASSVKKKNPWDQIGAAMNGFGTIINNLPDNFNSAFTVGKEGGQTQGAFLG